jgi:tetratricopeptide (TPR) repeat protein
VTVPGKSSGFQFSIGKAAVSLVFLGALFACWRSGLKWVAAPIVALFVLYYLLMPKIVASRLQRFRKEALKLFAEGRAGEIPGLAKRNFTIRMFGPSGPLDAKLALAYVAQGDYPKALPCFENAMLSAPPQEKAALQIGLAKSLFVTGDLARAEELGRSALDAGIKLPELLAVVARSRVGLGKNDDATRELLNEAERLSPNGDERMMIELTRIETAIATGRSPKQMPENADSSQRFLRSWIHLVRGKLRERRNDIEEAEASYKNAAQTGGCGFAVAEARECLEKLERKAG